MAVVDDYRKVAAAQDRMLSGIESLGDKVSLRFTQDLANKARHGRVTLGKNYQSRITNELVDLMLLGFLRQYQAQSRRLGLNLSFNAEIKKIASQFDLDLGNLRKSFHGFAQGKVRESSKLIEQRINNALADITRRDLTERQGARELERALEKMGLTAKNASLPRTLVRTHSQIAFNAAQYKVAQDDPDDVVWGYRYVTMGDDRVRESHARLEGLVRAKDDPIWDSIWPPNGWNCRCQVVAITRPQRQSRVPRDAEPDDGFDFNPGKDLT